MNSNITDAIEDVIKYCLMDILSAQSADTIMEKSHVIDLALDKAKTENKNLKNMGINQQQTEINPNQKKNLHQRIDIAKRNIGEIVIKKIIEEIPAQYIKLLSNDLEKISNTVTKFLQDPDKTLSDFTKQKLEQFLKNLENQFVDMTIDKWEIVTKGKEQHIECDFKFEIKKDTKQPVAIISINPPLGQNPLLKIKFKIDGNVKFLGMKISNLQKFKITLGNLDAALTIAIQEIKVMNATAIRQDDDILYTISERKIKYTLPEIVINNNS